MLAKTPMETIIGHYNIIDGLFNTVRPLSAQIHFGINFFMFYTPFGYAIMFSLSAIMIMFWVEISGIILLPITVLSLLIGQVVFSASVPFWIVAILILDWAKGILDNF